MGRQPFFLITAALLMLSRLSGAVPVLEPVQVLAPSDAAQGYGEDFGNSVAISGDWLVIGAPSDDELAGDAGAAYVFRRHGARWIEHQKLYGAPLFGETFGVVAIDGDWIVVGAPHANMFGGGIGRGFVFRRDEHRTPADLSDDFWQPAAFLHPPPSHLCCQFGSTVRINGDVIAVGSLRGESDPGRAYVFQWDSEEWQGPQTIMPSDSEPGDFFGWAVGVNNDLVVVSAHGDTYTCPGFDECRGSAYIFRRDLGTWAEESKLEANGLRGIGSNVGASENGIACGGWGVVQVFQYESAMGWMKEAILTPSDPFVNQFASYHLAMRGNRILVSAADAFWAYLFHYDNDTWTEVAKFARPEGLYFSRVALDGQFALALNRVYAIGEAFTLADYAELQNCMGLSGDTFGCERFDLQPDDVIDVQDLPLFLLTLRGPQ